MELELDNTKATAGNRKHLAMLERLSKRTAPSSVESPEASPVAAFLSRFAEAKVAAESALSACRSFPDDVPSSLAAASCAVDDLERLVAEASHSLPPYELRSALAAVSDFRAAHKLAASEIRPKKSFSFRNESKTPKNPLPDPPALSQPPPEQPKPNSDVILPGFGFRSRNGATLVKDLRAANKKDGDFTLADLVSCEVYLKGKCRALYIHKLRDCRVFIGPVFGSVLIEDVERCTFVMAAHQIRIHEARATDFYLRVRSRPIIEDCSGVRFAPHALKYEGIEEDLRDSGLAEDTGNWANVDDFKWLRAVQSPNWCLVPEEERLPIVDISEVQEREDCNTMYSLLEVMALYLIVVDNGKFREDSFQKCLNALAPASGSDKRGNGGKKGDSAASAKENVKIDSRFTGQEFLGDDDEKLPQVSNTLPLLEYGIGMHHSGILPNLK